MVERWVLGEENEREKDEAFLGKMVEMEGVGIVGFLTARFPRGGMVMRAAKLK